MWFLIQSWGADSSLAANLLPIHAPGSEYQNRGQSSTIGDSARRGNWNADRNVDHHRNHRRRPIVSGVASGLGTLSSDRRVFDHSQTLRRLVQIILSQVFPYAQPLNGPPNKR